MRAINKNNVELTSLEYFADPGQQRGYLFIGFVRDITGHKKIGRKIQ